jgi:predicted ATP-dependent endonuclease of OLD family
LASIFYEDGYNYSIEEHSNVVRFLVGLARDNYSTQKDYKLRQNLSGFQFLTQIVEDLYHVKFDLFKNGDALDSMSYGKKALLVLQLLLSLSDDNHPILIDQPEDNLDNRSISTELVEFLREKKKNTQIIVDTHNPNVVVLADSEEVIVANQSNQNAGENANFRFE